MILNDRNAPPYSFLRAGCLEANPDRSISFLSINGEKI